MLLPRVTIQDFLSTMAYPASDLGSNDGLETIREPWSKSLQTDITVSDSDKEYLPENNPGVSSSEGGDKSGVYGDAGAAM